MDDIESSLHFFFFSKVLPYFYLILKSYEAFNTICLFPLYFVLYSFQDTISFFHFLFLLILVICPPPLLCLVSHFFTKAIHCLNFSSIHWLCSIIENIYFFFSFLFSPYFRSFKLLFHFLNLSFLFILDKSQINFFSFLISFYKIPVSCFFFSFSDNFPFCLLTFTLLKFPSIGQDSFFLLLCLSFPSFFFLFIQSFFFFFFFFLLVNFLLCFFLSSVFFFPIFIISYKIVLFNNYTFLSNSIIVLPWDLNSFSILCWIFTPTTSTKIEIKLIIVSCVTINGGQIPSEKWNKTVNSFWKKKHKKVRWSFSDKTKKKI